MTGIDTHAHVFARGLTLAEGRRYAPDYDAPVEDYLRRLDENGLSHGVLVQPSFLGTDNGFMLDVHSRLTRPRTAALAQDAIREVADTRRPAQAEAAE